MIRALTLFWIGFAAVTAAVALSGCTADQIAKAKVYATAACTYDANVVPGLVATGSTIAVVVDPLSAPQVAALNGVDQLAHAGVQAACASVGGKPVSVSVTTAPVVTAPVAAPAN